MSIEVIGGFIEGTEVLTASGWKDFRTLKDTDLIAEYNDDHSVKFVKPSAFYCEEGNTGLIEFISNKYHSVVTPKHNCVLLPKDDDSDHLFMIKAEDVVISKYSIPISVTSNETKKDNLSNIDILNLFYHFYGSFVKGSDNDLSDTGYKIHLYSSLKLSFLLEVIDELDLRYKKTLVYNGSTVIFIPKQDIDLHKDFDWVNLATKSYSWCRKFINVLTSLDDGHWEAGSSYSTTEKTYYDKVSAIAALSGYRVDVENSDGFNSPPVINMIFHNEHHIKGEEITKYLVPYDGKVYNVKVPSGMILVRYKDKVSISTSY